MKVLVSGAHGLIGSALVESLLADGHQAVRLVRSSPRGDDVVWDPFSGDVDLVNLEGLDAVVHLAGVGIGDRRWTTARKRAILESRTIGTAALVDTLRKLARPPRVLVSGSAVGYYGDRGDELLTEASGPGDDFTRGSACSGRPPRRLPAQPASVSSPSGPASCSRPTAACCVGCCCRSVSASGGGSDRDTST